jgi:hypothetical protein
VEAAVSRWSVTLYDAAGTVVTSCDFEDANSETAKAYLEITEATAKKIGGRVEVDPPVKEKPAK